MYAVRPDRGHEGRKQTTYWRHRAGDSPAILVYPSSLETDRKTFVRTRARHFIPGTLINNLHRLIYSIKQHRKPHAHDVPLQYVYYVFLSKHVVPRFRIPFGHF